MTIDVASGRLGVDLHRARRATRRAGIGEPCSEGMK
jgi:hypothetical protein